jgi:hypothetical protein
MVKDDILVRLEKLEAENIRLKDLATRSADILEILNLHARYNYYLEQGRFDLVWEECITHKDPRAKVELTDSGVYEGLDKVKRIFMNAANKKPIQQRGVMPTLFIATPLVVVSKDGKTAKGQWHVFGPHAMKVTPYPGDEQKLTAYWFFGKYDDEFVKEDGKWKFLSLRSIVWFRSPIDQGWLKQQDCRRIPTYEDFPPDKPPVITVYHPDGLGNWGPMPPPAVDYD